MRDELGVSIIYITHDLATAYYISDRIIIMQKGKVVESGDGRRSSTTRNIPTPSCSRRRCFLRTPRSQAIPPAEPFPSTTHGSRGSRASGATEMREVKVAQPQQRNRDDRQAPLSSLREAPRGCICGGLHEAGHPSATPEGFRRDMLELAPVIGDRIIMQKSRVVE